MPGDICIQKGIIMHELIKRNPVTAILRHTPSEDLEAYTGSLYAGGLRSFEVSFSTKDAVRQLRWMKENMPEDACIGAGTILTKAEAEEALAEGADFLLSPAASPEILSYCSRNHVRFLPGVFTPSDVALCLSYGFHTLKLFPAGDLPAGYIDSLHGPFPSAEFVAVGGISPANAAAYLQSGYVGVGIGSSLVSHSLFQDKNWKQITEEIHEFLSSLRKDGLI